MKREDKIAIFEKCYTSSFDFEKMKGGSPKC